MALLVWTQPSGYSFGTFPERVRLSQNLPVATDNGVVYRVISGKLPAGLVIEENRIVGTPFEVSRTTEYTFCIRASNSGEIADRTYRMSIDGSDEPVVLTPAGELPVGPYQQLFVLDSTFVDYQIEAFDQDTAVGQQLTYFIAFNDGELPPGLILTESGRITGFVQPTLALRPEDGNGTYDNSYYDAYAFDFAVRPSNGYDSFFYDNVIYDFSIPAIQPRKLNRKFVFTVTVTDGDTFVKRTFSIFVVGDDYFRVDNTRVLEEGLFTADNTFLRSPIWITASNLGTYRANNYVTLVLDTYDTQNVIYNFEQVNADILASTEKISGTDNLQAGNVLTIRVTTGIPVFGQYLTFANELFLNDVDTSKIYQISNVEKINNELYRLTLTDTLVANIPDSLEFYIGSLSQLPPGLEFDVPTAELRGTVPYQPAITKTYSFTVTAKRFSDSQETVKSARKFTVNIIGEIDSVISWNTASDLGEIDANYISTLAVNAISNIPNAIVLYSLESGRLPPGLTLDLSGEIVGKVNQFGDRGSNILGLTTFDDRSNTEEFNGGNAFTIYDFSDTRLDGGDATSNYVGDSSLIFGGSASTTFIPLDNPTTFDNSTTTFDRIYVFTIRANDQYGLSSITKTFTVKVNTPNQLVYSNIRVKPFLKIEQRSVWKAFINDNNIFTTNSIYRPNDLNFGVQSELSMVILSGIETKEAARYISAMGLNHKRKRFHFGEIKTATAMSPGTKTPVYEVVYIEMVDPLESNGKRLPLELKNLGLQTKKISVDNSSIIWQGGFTKGFNANGDPLVGFEEALNLIINGGKIANLAQSAPDSVRPEPIVTIDSTAYLASNPNPNNYYPNSVSNWRDRLKEVGEIERNYLPLWMRSIQPGGKEELGFKLAVPICYCKVGTAKDIVLNIKFSGFDFKLLDYTADRYIIDAIEGQNTDKYLVFRNDRITV
jgi:hypothetical protein